MHHHDSTKFFTILGLTLLSTLICVTWTWADPIPEPRPAPAGMDIKMDNLKCDGDPLTIPPDVNSTLMGCIEKMKAEWAATGKKGFMPLQRMACGAVCGAQGLGLLDDAGKPTADTAKVEALVARILPPRNQKAVTDGLMKCVKKNSKKLVIKPGDCSSYGMMLFCIKESLSKICKF